MAPDQTPRSDAEYHSRSGPHAPCGWVALTDYGYGWLKAQGWPCREGLDDCLEGYWATECTWEAFRLERQMLGMGSTNRWWTR